MATADGNRPYSGGVPVYETRHGGDVSLSQTIIEAVASAEGVDPTDRDLELYEAVDLEALDALYDRRSPGDHWQFEFAIDGYLVVVTGDGNVSVWDE
jgi:hypothetical protein